VRLPYTMFTVASELRFHITVGRAIRPSTVKRENFTGMFLICL